MTFLPPYDPRLKQTSRPVPKDQLTNREIQKDIETMLKIAYGEQKDNKKPIMVGLAAPQIGILKRIILVDVKADGKGKVGNLRVFINPEIIWTSQEKGEWYEGCFSTGKVCGIVSRAVSVQVKGFILASQGLALRAWKVKKVDEKYSGYIARIFQHEIDHLNGKRFPDLITNPDNLHWVKKSEFDLYRNEQVRASGTKQTWRNWPKKCSFEKWRKIKGKL